MKESCPILLRGQWIMFSRAICLFGCPQHTVDLKKEKKFKKEKAFHTCECVMSHYWRVNSARWVAQQFECVADSATHCIALQLTASHRRSLQHTGTHCNTLQHAATRCNTLQHIATHCNTLQLTATYWNTLQHTATRYNTLQHTDA